MLILADTDHPGLLVGGYDRIDGVVGEVDDIHLVAEGAGHDGVVVAGGDGAGKVTHSDIGDHRHRGPIEDCDVVGMAVRHQRPLAIAREGVQVEVVTFGRDSRIDIELGAVPRMGGEEVVHRLARLYHNCVVAGVCRRIQSGCGHGWQGADDQAADQLYCQDIASHVQPSSIDDVAY